MLSESGVIWWSFATRNGRPLPRKGITLLSERPPTWPPGQPNPALLVFGNPGVYGYIIPYNKNFGLVRLESFLYDSTELHQMEPLFDAFFKSVAAR